MQMKEHKMLITAVFTSLKYSKGFKNYSNLKYGVTVGFFTELVCLHDFLEIKHILASYQPPGDSNILG